MQTNQPYMTLFDWTSTNVTNQENRRMDVNKHEMYSEEKVRKLMDAIWQKHRTHSSKKKINMFYE